LPARKRTSEQGTTLIELSIYMLVLAIILSIAFRLLISMTTSIDRTDISTQSADQARLAVQQLDRQVRSGNVLYDPETEATDTSNDIAPGFTVRVYTQANGDQKCVQWRITDEGELQYRSWSETWTVDGDVDKFQTVARNIVNRPGQTPAQPKAFARPAGFANRLLTVKVITNVDAKRAKNVTYESTITGRNTDYGYSPFICQNTPPYS
jgi:Tfp pilus assembly protein PilE